MVVEERRMSVEKSERVVGADSLFAQALHDQYDLHRSPQRIMVSFFPEAVLTPEQKKSIFGKVNYSDLDQNDLYKKKAQESNLVVHPMNGGIGSSLQRLSYLQDRWESIGRKGEPRLGAKGTDLFHLVRDDEGNARHVSIMQAKCERLLKSATDFNKVHIEDLLNDESVLSYNEFLDTPTFSDPHVTYRQAFEAHPHIVVKHPIIQQPLWTIDKETRTLTSERMAPGSHGQLGTMLLESFSHKEADEGSFVHAIYNGDGTNNSVSAEMVGFTVEEKAGIVMVVTPRTENDYKGGIIGIRRETGSLDGRRRDTFVSDILELAQAKEAGQKDDFFDIGFGKRPETAWAKGEQSFNTNIALFNEGTLGVFLPRLRILLGEEQFAKAITPELIQNEKVQNGKTFIQLEGALASVIFRLNACVEGDDRVQALWNEVSGGKKFLRMINLDGTYRDEYFTPTKYAIDFAVQAHTDHFTLNPNTWVLENNRPGKQPKLNDELVEDSYYSDMNHTIDSFGDTSLVDLSSLTIKGVQVEKKNYGGKVKLQGAVLKGDVSIVSSFEGVFDLNASDARKQLGQEGLDPLLLENISLFINQEGEITVMSLEQQIRESGGVIFA